MTETGRRADPSPAGEGHASFGRAFWRLWVATGCSSLGDGLVLVAFPLLALTLTRDPLLISGVAVAARLPALVVGLGAGALADRTHRRRLAVTVEWVRLGVLTVFSGLLALGDVDLVMVYAVVFVLGCLQEAFVAVTFASLPAMVEATELERANGLLSLSDLTAEEVAGQGLGGLLSALGRSVPFAGDAVSFLASAVLLRRALPDVAVTPTSTSVRRDILSGLRWFAGHRPLRLLALLIGSYAFCQYAVYAVLVIYLRHDLHLSDTGYGVLLGLSALGNVLGAVTSRWVVRRVGAAGAIAGVGVIAGASYLILGADRSVVGAAAALTLECLAITIGNVASMSLRQRLIPSAMLGRAGMTFRTIVYAGLPGGALLGGALAEMTTVRTTFIVAGTTQLGLLAILAPRFTSCLRGTAVEAGEVRD